MRSGKHFMSVYLLVSLFTAAAHAGYDVSRSALLDADDIAVEWVSLEAFAFNLGQRKITQNQSYENVSPQQQKAASARLCRFVDIMRNKISQVDLTQDTKITRCGFKRAQVMLDDIACAGSQQITAHELARRHSEVMRASAVITTSTYIGVDCP